MTIPLTYGGIKLDVEVEYTPEEVATYDDPGFADDLSVLKVFLKGVDIRDLMDQGNLDEIGDMAIEAIRAMDREEA